MQRFLVFPLTLGFAGAFFPIISWAEWIFASWPVYSVDPYPAILNLAQYVFATTLPYGATAGVTTGIGFAFWDLVRHCHRQNSVQLLLANLFWCLCYATLVVVINCGICAAMLWLTVDFTRLGAGLSPTPSLTNLLTTIFFVHASFNFAAILWASVRSIQTEDVLTPRVLRDKLRERARLN